MTRTPLTAHRSPRTLGVGVVGCGLIGKRRAREAAASDRSRCVAVTDTNQPAATETAKLYGAEVVTDWQKLVERKDLDVVVVATPNAFLDEIATAAMEAGKHVLVEKPMGRSVAEAEHMAAVARARGKKLKVGFNHRYHPGIAEAARRFKAGEIGDLINLRCRYGHGGRPGAEKEWRGSRAMAGGGELTDQGVHVLDLIHWFAGVPRTAFAYLQTAVWPLGDLEDNAFGLLRFESSAVASLHASMTQWKNLFSFEVFGCDGALVVEGLGGSYGVETLTVYRRKPEGGVPHMERLAYEGEDVSWRLEWIDFVNGVLDDTPMLGVAQDGIIAMRMLDALYRSAASRSIAEV